MKKLVLALIIALAPGLALAQGQQVITTPSMAVSVDASSTITTTDTFQSLQGLISSPNRRLGCLIQNNGTHSMYVFNGAIASADKAKSFTIIPPATGVQGGSFNCATAGGGVLQDQISITGTSGEAFTAKFQ